MMKLKLDLNISKKVQICKYSEKTLVGVGIQSWIYLISAGPQCAAWAVYFMGVLLSQGGKLEEIKTGI